VLRVLELRQHQRLLLSEGATVTRTLLAGAKVFDGTGSAPAEADVVIEDGRFVAVGPGLDGDESVDVSGMHLLPGLFDCHVHVVGSHLDTMKYLETPLSYLLIEAARNLEITVRLGITTIRDAAGADLGIKRAVEEGLIKGPRMQISLTMLSQTGGHGDDWMPCGEASRSSRHTRECPAAWWMAPRRCGRRFAS
jgi:imidazolonepropionase-like amidohydrolase